MCSVSVNGTEFKGAAIRAKDNTDLNYIDDSAAKMLCSVIRLRSDSITGQLNGTVPSDTEAQKTDPSALIDTSDTDLTIMCRMSAGEKQER